MTAPPIRFYAYIYRMSDHWRFIAGIADIIDIGQE